MKLFYIDLVYPIGHKRQNEFFINILSKIIDTKAYVPKNYYKNIDKYNLIEESPKLKVGRFKARLTSFKITLRAAALSRKEKPKYIFIASYDTIIFALCRIFFFKKSNIMLLQHNNIDETTNRVKRFFFNSYKKKVSHIVFEDFIKDYLITCGIDKNVINVIPHQINKKSTSNDLIHKTMYECVALSNSNDEDFITDIIKSEKSTSFFLDNKIKIIIKSKYQEFDNDYLTVFNGFLKEDFYDQKISQAKSIFMPFPVTFKYRMSGTLVDSLSSNKILIGNNIPLITHYNSKFPNICKNISDVNSLKEFLLILKNNEITEEQQNEFSIFKEEHSDKKIEKIFTNLFKS